MKNKAFTLVELLAVIAIIGITSTFVLINTNKKKEEYSKISNDEIKEIIRVSTHSYIVSSEEITLARYIAESMLSKKNVLRFIKDFNSPLFEDWEIHYQKPLYFKYKDIDCKALPDILLINNQDKLISIIDIKTTALKTLDFYQAVSKYRYDIQLAFYKLALETLFPGYFINAKFIVDSTTQPGNPIKLEVTDNLLKQGKQGRESIFIQDTIIKRKLKGFDELIDDYKFYMSRGFETDRIIVEKENLFNLDIDYIS